MLWEHKQPEKFSLLSQVVPNIHKCLYTCNLSKTRMQFQILFAYYMYVGSQIKSNRFKQTLK